MAKECHRHFVFLGKLFIYPTRPRISIFLESGQVVSLCCIIDHQLSSGKVWSRMKLDARDLRYVSTDEFKVLSAVSSTLVGWLLTGRWKRDREIMKSCRRL